MGYFVVRWVTGLNEFLSDKNQTCHILFNRCSQQHVSLYNISHSLELRKKAIYFSTGKNLYCCPHYKLSVQKKANKKYAGIK